MFRISFTHHGQQSHSILYCIFSHGSSCLFVHNNIWCALISMMRTKIELLLPRHQLQEWVRLAVWTSRLNTRSLPSSRFWRSAAHKDDSLPFPPSFLPPFRYLRSSFLPPSFTLSLLSCSVSSLSPQRRSQSAFLRFDLTGQGNQIWNLDSRESTVYSTR